MCASVQKLKNARKNSVTLTLLACRVRNWALGGVLHTLSALFFALANTLHGVECSLAVGTEQWYFDCCSVAAVQA